MLKFALGGLLAVLLLNGFLRMYLKLGGVPVTMGISAWVAGLIAAWFARSVGRAPTRQERSRLVWYYGLLLGLGVGLLVGAGSLVRPPTSAGLFVFLLHYLPYPAFVQLFLSEKYFHRFMRETVC